MSEREQIQNDLVEFMENSPRWTAPYGILSGLESVGKGKVRTITFGVSRVLDATMFIWSPTRFTFRAAGALANRFDVECHSVEEVKKLLESI